MTKDPSVHRDSDREAGVALVMVVIVMLVGFVIASLIAASLLFTFAANRSNKSQTQAFVAAESGRDSMLAAIMGDPSGCVNSVTSSTTTPKYTGVSAAYSDASGSTPCLSAAATATIKITSTGIGPSGEKTTVVSTYQRLVTTTQQPGGSLAYFSGTFKLTQSTYKGDVVIRDGNYTCTSASTITGDLWVPRGGVDISSSCNVNGNIYARDAIRITGSGSVIGTSGDPATGTLACRDCTAFGGPSGPPSGITVKGPATIWKDILSSTNVNLQNVTVAGSVKAGGSVTVTGNNVTVGGVPMPAGTTPQNISPSPSSNAFSPSLDDVYAMTSWLDLGAVESQWGTDVKWVIPTSANCNMNVTSILSSPPGGSYTRYGIDYRNCTTNPTITFGPGNIPYSAVFLVPASANMNVNITANVTSIGAPTTPQMFFIHADGAPATPGPNCGTSTPLAPNDSFNQTNNTTMAPYMMFYTPCGLGTIPNQNQVAAYNGQFYAADNESTPQHWVQPNFVCKPMAWSPLIDLGCYIKDAVANGNSGTIQTTVHAPALVSELEQSATGMPTP